MRLCHDAARAGRLCSMPATNSGMLIGLARNGCPWICRPDFVSDFVTRAVKKTIGVLFNVGSDSIRAATAIRFRHRDIEQDKIRLKALRCLMSFARVVLFIDEVAARPFQRELG